MAKELEAISLRDIIPRSIGQDKNVKSIITATDPEFRKVSQDVREAFIISRINELPENVVDLLAWQWHVDSYEPDLPISTKRELVLDSVKWHRKKGTKASIESALAKLGFVPTIKEWFEIGTVPHTFEVYGHYKDNDLKVDFLGPNTDEILTRVIEITKPARSKLLSLIVAPIPIDFHEHACYWDKCIWGHPVIELHDWGLLPLPVFENEPLSGFCFVHGFNVVSDSQFWDFYTWEQHCTWGGSPYRELIFGRNVEHGIFADLQRESTATWYIPYGWGNFTWRESEKYSRDFEMNFLHGMDINTDVNPQPLGMFYVLNIFASLQPYWDFYTWEQHDTWNGFPYRELKFGRNVERGILADLQRESTATWYIPYSWEKFTWEESEKYSRDFEMYFQRGMNIDADVKPQPFGLDYVVNMLASLQPCWDLYTWTQHDDWGENFGVSRFAPAFQRDHRASVQWEETETPFAKWSKFRTWSDSTWDKEPTCAGTCQTGTWIDLEEAV